MRVYWLKYRLLVPIIASFVMLIYGIFESWSASQITLQEEASVLQTTMVIAIAKDALGNVIDAEIGVRRHIITKGGLHYLDLYHSSRSAAMNKIAKLEAMTHDTVDQRLRIENLKNLVTKKFQELENTQSAYENSGKQAVDVFLREGPSKLLMDQIRATILDIESVETSLLVERQAKYNQAANRLSNFSTLSIIASFILAFFTIYIINKQRQSLQLNQHALLEFNCGLEHAVSTRTAELMAFMVELDQQRSLAELERSRVEMLLRELNHRVGNNLAMISAFLGLEATQTQSAEVHKIIERARNRIQAIATAQRRLRFDDNLVSVDTLKTLSDVLHDLINTVRNDVDITLETDIADVYLTPRDITALAIILSEIFTNAIKYAFIGRTNNHICVRLKKAIAGIELTVQDNGTGFDVDEIMGTNKSLGQTIIIRLARQYSGVAIWTSSKPSGTVVTVTLPKMPVIKDDPA